MHWKSAGSIMSKVPIGKVLLRNVIRHTDAHNKIQEESEMWKLRGMEKGPSTSQRLMPPSDLSRSHMHCDRVEDGSGDRLRDRLGRQEHSSGQYSREARYWTKQLYDFEANDPDRWGHSGFKELYPEEFKSDGESDSGNNHHRRKKKKASSSETSKSHLKKSSKRKKRKKEEKQGRVADVDKDASNKQRHNVPRKQKRKRSKSKNKRKTSERSREKEASCSEVSDIERRKRQKPQQLPYRDLDSPPESHKRRRTDWKAGEDQSEDSPDD
ncbi:hypothetical protein UPYG_G00200820 [Umbra pygmaea]|uniref:NKAP domain containing 1 n=1 Tax=Umbra pygmaea TaxID=75934 RepID=A0ABD0X4B4_UMBPY